MRVKPKDLLLTVIALTASFSIPSVCAQDADEEKRTRLFVASDAKGTKSGSNWANAYTDISHALAKAGTLNKDCEIWVKSGLYAGELVLPPKTTVVCGFLGTETDAKDADFKQNRVFAALPSASDVDEVEIPESSEIIGLWLAATNENGRYSIFSIKGPCVGKFESNGFELRAQGWITIDSFDPGREEFMGGMRLGGGEGAKASYSSLTVVRKEELPFVQR